NRPERGLAGGVFRQIVAVDRQEPADFCAAAFKIARGATVVVKMSDIALRSAEHMAQHIEEMHADIGGYASRLGLVALPGRLIPTSARGDVSEVDGEIGLRRSRDFFFEILDR